MTWWLWLAFGLVLLLVELVTPGGLFAMFFGAGAIAVGILAGLGLVSSEALQWLIFTALSVIVLLLLRGRLGRNVIPPPDTIDTLVGELAVPRERIEPGKVGPVDLRGTVWNARNQSPEALVAGQRCRVTGVEGLLVFVQPE